jgi:HK97 gp10 family phage protein
VLQSKIITNISTPSRPTRSRPSQFPHADSGKLRQSIVLIPARAESRVIRARVGTPLLYAKFLEVGTRKMLPRPFLRRTLRESLPELRRIFSEGGAP